MINNFDFYVLVSQNESSATQNAMSMNELFEMFSIAMALLFPIKMWNLKVIILECIKYYIYQYNN